MSFINQFNFFQISRGALSHTICAGNIERVKYLVERGVDINEKDNEGSTPLILAAILGNAEVVGLLINKGADIEAKNAHGQTALSAAAGIRRNNIDILRLLVDKGALLDEEKDLMGWTILKRAEAFNTRQAFQFLTEVYTKRTQEKEKQKRETALRKQKVLRSAIVLQHDLPYKKSPFKIKRK